MHENQTFINWKFVILHFNCIECIRLLFHTFFHIYFRHCVIFVIWFDWIRLFASWYYTTCISVLNVAYRICMRITHFKRNFCFPFCKFALQLINVYLCKIRNEMQYRHPNTKLISRITFPDNWLVRLNDDEVEYGKPCRFMIVVCIPFASHFPSTIN